MQAIRFFNEKGNVSVSTRNEVRTQALAKLVCSLTSDECFESVESNANGGLSIPVAIDKGTGATIYANIELTISTKDPSVRTKKKAGKPKAKTPVVVPNLFE